MTERPKRPVQAYRNPGFLNSKDARELRILAEYLEPKSRFDYHKVDDTIVFMGSARLKSREAAEEALRAAEAAGAGVESARMALKMSVYYEAARSLAFRLTSWSKELDRKERRFVVCTGGGPGIMEAANRGAAEAHGVNVGLTISIPTEEFDNPYVTRELAFHFHYFFMRKFWFAYLAKAVLLLHDPAPALDVRLDDRAKLLGRAACRGHAVGGQQVAHVLRLQHLVGFAVEAIHDRARHALGGHQAVPEHDLVTRHSRLGDGGKVRQRRDASRGGDGQAAQAAGLDELKRGRDAAENQLRAARDRVVQRRAGALVRDVDDLDLGHVEEQLARQVRDAARAGRRVRQLVRLAPRQLDQLLQVVRRHRGMHRDHERPLRELDDRRDVVHRVERQLVQARVHRVAARHQQQGVTVGRRLDRKLGAQIAASAGLVLDDHLVAEPLGELLRDQPRDEIGAAAGSERRDDAHRLGGILLALDDARRQSQHREDRATQE